ncbi:MAG: MFS transporter [Rhodanobacter sp. 68-29]|nr:MFS transporter [Rhodanobacter sp.]ODU74977.1 MAG: MFS transporter [Rhodanobacter sp. SCN 69-32]OJY61494.1 MAG: MFS transporter [Rhodanobacter sp. 68-29]
MPPQAAETSSPTDAAAAPEGAAAPPEISTRQRYRGLLWLVAAAFFMQSLDSTVVNTAVPAMADALRETPLGMRSALTSYVLTLAVLIPASPWLCDRFGTRRVFGGAIVLFGLGSLLCGLSQTLTQLVAARVLQGMGGAALMPVGRYVLVRSIDRREFVRAMSTVATFGLLGSVLGPLLGGALVEYTSWRLIFLINVPVAIAGVWMNRHDMPEYRLEHANRFDLAGFLLFALASALLLTASELAGAEPVPWLQMAACGMVALALGAVYVWHSRRTPHPVADLSLLRVRNVWVSLAGGLFTRLGISGMFLLLMLFLQVGCGWSPLAAGLMMVPQALGSIAAKWMVNRALVHYGYRRLLLGNTLIVAVLLAAFAMFGPGTPPWVIALFTFCYGGFTGLQYTTMNTLIYHDLDISHASMASSMASTVQYLAMSFGIALSTLLMQALLRGHAPEDFVVAFRWTVLLLGLITAAASRVFGRLRPDRPAEALPSAG